MEFCVYGEEEGMCGDAVVAGRGVECLHGGQGWVEDF